MNLAIVLFNSSGPIVQFPLREKNSQVSLVEDIINASKEKNQVHSDWSYPNAEIVSSNDCYDIIRFLINDEIVSYFPSSKAFENDILFTDYFGYVRITVCAKRNSDSTIDWFETGLIPVLVKKNKMIDNVQDMAKYVYEHFKLFLYNAYQNKGALGQLQWKLQGELAS